VTGRIRVGTSGNPRPSRVPPSLVRSILLLACCVALPAGEARFSLVLEQQPAQTALALASRLGAGEHLRRTDELVSGAGTKRITVYLRDASLAGTRQALAHAQGCWWLPDGTGTLYTSSPHPPLGPIEARMFTSGLVNLPALETHVQHLLAPWLGDPACGISYMPAEGLWTATLDRDGQSRMVEALTMLERSPAACPPLLADPDQLAPTCRLESPILAADWADLAKKISATMGVSVSCSTDLPPSPPTISIQPGVPAAICTQLIALGMKSVVMHGVLCLGRDQPRDSEHPAHRRRLALLPIKHLVSSEAEAQLLVTAIRAQVAPWWWNLPGAVIFYHADRQSLVLAADPETVHGVVDLLDRVDLLGFNRTFSEQNP